MDTIKFPENNCPLCDLELTDVSIPYNSDGRSRYYLCKNCGPFAISYMAYRFTPIISDDEIKAKLSYYVKHNSTEDRPVFIKKENYKEIVEGLELPLVSEQLKLFLAWFGDESKKSLDQIQSDVRYLVASIGCKNSKQVVHLLDELWNEKFIEMELPTTGPLRERATFRKFAAHLTTKGLAEIERNEKAKSQVYELRDLTVESILLQNEGDKFEVKGSLKLNLNQLFKGDRQRKSDITIAKDGVLKTIVAFLNSNGGCLLIGAIEKNKFNKNELGSTFFIEIGEYSLIGIAIEISSQDKYQLELRDLIAQSISKNLFGLIEISFQEVNGLTACIIKVSPDYKQWYYLDKVKFYVREGNRTVEFQGLDADEYKKSNNR